MTLGKKARRDKEDEHDARADGSWQQKENDTRFRALIDGTLTDEDWKRIFRRLARSNNIRAAEILLKYRFGRTDLAGADPSGQFY